jgi:hypothetical protein
MKSFVVPDVAGQRVLALRDYVGAEKNAKDEGNADEPAGDLNNDFHITRITAASGAFKSDRTAPERKTLLTFQAGRERCPFIRPNVPILKRLRAHGGVEASRLS